MSLKKYPYSWRCYGNMNIGIKSMLHLERKKKRLTLCWVVSCTPLSTDLCSSIPVTSQLCV